MKSYRKSDQEYYDRFDRHTIEWLKEIEEEEKKEYPKTLMVKGKPYLAKKSPFLKLHDRGVERSRQREVTVRQWMREDEEHDKIVEKHRIPEGLRCDTCDTRMYLNGHLFDTFGQKFLFVFDCPTEKHKSRKIAYPSGEVMIFPKPKCEKCGNIITSSTKKKKLILICTDTCKSCGYKNSYQYDMTPKMPIIEEDRKKYCQDFIGRHTFMEDLKALSDFWERYGHTIEEKKLKEEYDIDKIEKLQIPQVKERLMKVSLDSGFTELQFEKPELRKNVLIEFSIQDPSSRNESDSIKFLFKTFSENLLYTNWRTQKKSIFYRLGYLTGKIIAYEDDTNLIKIGKEIKESEQKKK